jgi:hypothetical protein
MTDDAKFAGIQTGAYGWFWDAEKTTIARVTRDGSGKVRANWGDGCGSERLPDGPAVEAPLEGTCACEQATRCAQRGVALDLIRNELQQAMSILLRVKVDNPDVDKDLLKRVLTAHGIAMGVL